MDLTKTFMMAVSQGKLGYDGPTNGADNPSETSAVPIMTSDTTPSGVCSASYVHSSTYLPFKAFDEVSNKFWYATSLPQWIQYDFSEEIRINKFMLLCRPGQPESLPKTFDLLGSMTGEFNGEEDTLASVIDYTGHVSTVYSIFTFVVDAQYTSFRFNITDTGNGSNISIDEIRLIESQ